jgi:hypothetical protein
MIGPMRLQNDDTNEVLRAVWVYMTRSEAEQLFDSLAYRLSDEYKDLEPDPGWHTHVDSRDGDQELSLSLYSPDDPPI